MFIVQHVIRSMPAGLPNRGADGLAKRAVFGNVEHQRISPQCRKAHLRESAVFTEVAAQLGQNMSVRSALIADRQIAPILVSEGLKDGDAVAYAQAAMRFLFGSKKKDEAKPKKAKGKGKSGEPSEDEGEGDGPAEKRGAQILCLGRSEIEAIAILAATAAQNDMTPEDLAAGKSPNKAVKEAVEAIAALRSHAGFDGALFGRMATGSVFSNVDPAVAVSHSVSTHPIQSTTDFFSAQDQLLTEIEEGTAHIGTSEITMGVFYDNLVIDVERLKSNLGLTGADDLRLAVQAIIEADLTNDPSAKRGGTGAAAMVQEAIIEVGTSIGLSAVAAFEKSPAYTSDGAAERLRTFIENRRARLMPRQRPTATIVLSQEPDSETFLEKVLGSAFPALAVAAE